MLAIVGPTASGKSAVALALARQRPDIELVSVDSMQVYRGMDIGTAKPTPAERAEVPHHLIDIVDPAEDFTVTRFRAALDEAVTTIEGRGHRPVLVGGTGLYLRAVTDRLAIPARYPEVHARLEAEPDTAALYQRLAELDPAAAGRMTPGNRRRIVRALEVTLGSGRPFSSSGPGLSDYRPSPVRMVGLRLDDVTLRARVDARLDAMLAAGFVDEVRTLATKPLSRTARQAVGYRELLAHVEEDVELHAAVDLIRRRTWRLVRRQRAWFGRDPRVEWVDVGDNPLAALPVVLGNSTPCPV